MDKVKRAMIRVNRKTLGVILVMTLSVGIATIAHSRKDAPPREGVYLSQTGAEYQVSTSGMSALAIDGPDGLCLLFWRAKEPEINNGTEVLKGQECNDRSARWMVGFNSAKRGWLILYPPGMYENEAVRPISIRLNQS